MSDDGRRALEMMRESARWCNARYMASAERLRLLPLLKIGIGYE